jgi:hypothetical protein
MFLLLAPPCRAGTVPLHRHALERWERDPYPVTIFFRGAMGMDELAVTRDLVERSAVIRGKLPPGLICRLEKARANLTLRLVDLSDPLDGAARRLWKAQETRDLPWIVVDYPDSSGLAGPLWRGPLSRLDVKVLLDSPARRQVISALLNGDGIVWLLRLSGNAAADGEAIEVLNRTFADGGTAFRAIAPARSDPREVLFERMLAGCGMYLTKDRGEPAVFAISGRGRVFLCLNAGAITRDRIQSVIDILTGPPAAKAEYPGFDLLTCEDWDRSIVRSLVLGGDPLPSPLGTWRPLSRRDARERDPSLLSVAGNDLLRRSAAVLVPCALALAVAIFVLARERRLLVSRH